MGKKTRKRALARIRARTNPQPKPAPEIKNKHGVSITLEEKKELERLVNQANRNRNKQLSESKELPRRYMGRDTGQTLGDLQLMGQESDFILSQKTANVDVHKSRRDFDNYMRNLRRVTSPDYLNMRIRAYKQNFTKSLIEVYGWDAAKDIAMKVRMMKPEDYMRMVESDETLEISFVPSDQYVQGRLNQIRQALGMRLKEEWVDEEYAVN